MEASQAKSEQRKKYDFEIAQIRAKYGDLEAIRNSLGFSQRKMAELLMVDPSAWTRWTKGEGEAPPHVYRALSWYLELNPPTPKTSQTPKVDFAAESGEVPNHWQEQFEKMKSQYEKDLSISMGWKLFLMLNTAAVVYILLSIVVS